MDMRLWLHQSGLVIYNSEEKNTREASKRQCIFESVRCLVNSTTSISLMDFDAPDNRPHLKRAYQSAPVMFNSEKKDTGEGLSGQCLTKSALSFDDSINKSLSDCRILASFSEWTSQDLCDIGDLDYFDGFDNCAGRLPNLKDEFNDGLLSSCGDERIILSTTSCRDQHDAALLHFVNMDTNIHTSSPQPIGKIVQLESSEQRPLELLGWGCWDSMEFEQPGTLEELGMDPENEGIISDDLGFVRKKESCQKVGKAWTRFYMLYKPPGTHRSSLIAAMANYLKFDIYDLDLTSLSSIEGLQDMLFSTKNRSLIAIRDFDHCTAKLPILENELTVPLLSAYIDDLSTCGDERIIVFTTNHRDRHDAALLLFNVDTYIQNTSPRPVALPDEGESVQIDSSEHKPLVDFNVTCNRIYKSGVLVSNLEKKNTRGASKRRCMMKSVPSFDAPDNRAHLMGAHQRTSLMQLEHLENEGIISDLLEFLRDKELCKRIGKARKRGYLLYDSPCTDRSSLIAAMANCLEFDIYNLDLTGVSSISELTNVLVSVRSCSAIVIAGLRCFPISRMRYYIFWERVFTSSHQPKALTDGGEIVLLDSSEQKSQLVRAYQSGPVVSLSDDKNRGEALKRECITKSILGLRDLQQHSGRRRDDAAKSFCAIYDPGSRTTYSLALISYEVIEALLKQYEDKDFICFFAHAVSGSMSKSTCRQQWVYSRPGRFEKKDAWKSFEVLDSLSIGEQYNIIRHLARQRTLMHKHCLRLKKSQDLPRSMLRDCSGGLAAQSDISLPDGGHILSLSQKEIVRKTLKRKCRTMSVLSVEPHQEPHQQHVGRRWEDAVKFLGVKRICKQLVIQRETTAKRIRRQLGTHRWPCKQSAIRLPEGGHILYLSEKKIVRKTLKRKCRSMSVLSLEDHKQHVDRRCEDAAKSHGTKRICRQLSTAKRIRKLHGIHRWPFQRSTIGLPDGGHIVPLSEKKIVRKTIERKCRSMSILSLVNRQQHIDRRSEDAVKNIGAKHNCGQLMIHRVSIAKRICRQHGIYHWWPFERDWATMKGYSLGDERPVEVISLSMHTKLVSRRQLIYISWLGRFSPRPSDLAGGGEFGGPIASCSESAATNNIAQRFGQDQSGSAASDSENERTREQGDPKEINATITLDNIRPHYGRKNRGDTAAILQTSVATFKRKCREFGIKRWPHVRKKRVGRPPDRHGKGNTSTACEMPSHNVQTGMEGELVGQNQEANVVRQDFIGGPLSLNTESGLIMVSRPPDQHGERNTPTACYTPTHNVRTGMEGEPVGKHQEANEFRQDFLEGSTALNTENDSIIAVYSETEAARGSPKWAFQLEGQTMQSTCFPHLSDFVFSQSQIASTEVQNDNMGSLQDRRDLLASKVVAPWKELLPEGRVFGSGNPGVSCSDLAPSQPMQTCTHAMESLENFLEGDLMEENHFGSINLTVPPCSDPSSSQTMPAIHHTMATIPHMMPLPTEKQDTRSVKLKATYGDTNIKFQFPLTSGINELKEVMSKILERKLGSFMIEYKDEEGEWTLMALDEHVREYLQLLTSLGNEVTKLKVQDKVPNTMNLCDNCRCNYSRSLKRKRP